MPIDDDGVVEDLPGGSQANVVVDPINLASGLPCKLRRLEWLSIDLKLIRIAEEAVLAIVDFPKQVVVALAVIIQYMKGQLGVSQLRSNQLTC